MDLEKHEDDWVGDLMQSYEDETKEGRIRYCVPMRASGRLVGVMTLSSKVYYEPLSFEDSRASEDACGPGGGAAAEHRAFRAGAAGARDGGVPEHVGLLHPRPQEPGEQALAGDAEPAEAPGQPGIPGGRPAHDFAERGEDQYDERPALAGEPEAGSCSCGKRIWKGSSGSRWPGSTGS